VAYGLARYAATLLFGVTAHDPLTFALVPAALLTVAAGACFWPARRAAFIDPLCTIRSKWGNG
jgi:putative ABC transport system permease protein